MPYKFFEISKANEEITRLESAIADRDAALKAAQERITSLESQESNQEKTGPTDKEKQLEADLATARQTIKTLEGQVKTLEAEAKTTDARVEKLASQKALEITAAQGQPPVSVVPSETPAKTETKSNLKGLEKVQAAFAAEINKSTTK